MLRRFAVWGLVATALLIAGCAPAHKVEGENPEDRELLAKINKAADEGIDPDKVDAAVGLIAVVNTVRNADRQALSFVNIAEDPDRKPAFPYGTSVRWVAYWMRPVESHNPKIVGILWPEEGKAQMFYGLVLPP
jgi:hypothetical protein